MARRMLIDATHPEETRVVVINGNRLEEFDFETSTKRQIKGNIYLAKITRVEPSLQAAFVEYGGNRHGFLAFSEIHPDYYRIPVSDREAMLAAERAEDEEAARYAEDGGDPPPAFPQDHGVDDGFDHNRFEPGIGTDAHDAQPFRNERPGIDDDAQPYVGPEAFHNLDQYPTPAPTPVAGALLLTAVPPFAPPFPLDPTPLEQGADSTADAMAGEPDSLQSRAEHGVAAAVHYALADPAPPAADDRDGDGADFTSDGDAHDALSGSDQDRAQPDHVHALGQGDDGEEPIIVETVGGDEFEDVQARPRARHYRHYKIQEVIKRRQIILIQVTKEERGNKGAALTTYLSLAGRYCVLMPNAARGGGVSRKITSAADRRRLKELMEELEVPDGMGVIVRTAGSERSKQEIKRDYEYLLRLWDDIRDLTLRSSAPALIYEEGSLIKRAIRDLYSSDIEEILVEGEDGYRTAKEFMRMLMPSHASRVKLYRDPSIPLFHRFQIDAQIDQIHNPVCQLRSGGYIVINPTEALVSIDVNSGRATKERNIEETATKTNLEAAEEIARQLRLRDLAGLVVIDFIDMEDLRNQKAVESRLKDAMRQDRARIQLGRISPFGLLELSRQRLRSSLIEASTQICPHCNGSGTIRSTESTALVALRALEEEGIRRRTAEIELFVPTQIAFYLLNQKRDALAAIEHRYGFQVVVAPDDHLIQPAYRLERIRPLSPQELAALPIPTLSPEPLEEEEDFPEDTAIPAPLDAAQPQDQGDAAPPDGTADGGEDEDRPRRKRRRRKRRRGGGDERDASLGESDVDADGDEDEADDSADRPAGTPDAAGDEDGQAGTEEDESGDDGDDAVHADGSPLTDEERGDRKRRRRGKRGGRRRRRDDGPGAEAPFGTVLEQPIVEPEDLIVGYPPVLDFARDGREHIFTSADILPAPILATIKSATATATPAPVPDQAPEPAEPTPAPESPVPVSPVPESSPPVPSAETIGEPVPVAAPAETGPQDTASDDTGSGDTATADAPPSDDKPKRTRRAPARRKTAASGEVAETAATPDATDAATDAPPEKPKRAPRKRKASPDAVPEVAAEPIAAPVAAPVAEPILVSPPAEPSPVEPATEPTVTAPPVVETPPIPAPAAETPPPEPPSPPRAGWWRK